MFKYFLASINTERRKVFASVEFCLLFKFLVLPGEIKIIINNYCLNKLTNYINIQSVK